MEDTPVSSDIETEAPPEMLKVQVIGGPKDRVVEAFRQQLSPQEEPRVYRTWFNIRLLSRLENLFKDGIESAGGLFEIICVFFVAMMIIGFVLLSQLIIFSIVVVVMAIFSGGASLKFFRTTFVETPITNIDTNGLENFTAMLVKQGSLVSIETNEPSVNMGNLITRSNKATKSFLYGINIAQFTAMVFILAEVIYYILFRTWLADIPILAIFGIVFLLGIIVMDVGVVLRHRLAKTLMTDQ